MLAGLLLSALFFFPLFRGGGLIGGDLYPYFFPQKQYLSDSLQRGQIPLWNSLVGFGYPVLGESQTAALYPPNLLLYSWLPVNLAYNVSQLAHYLVCFVAFFFFAKRMGARGAGALFASIVFTFGWFPARICLEWAIIGGCWFSICAWLATAWLQTQQRRYLCALAISLGMFLLAGHYNLAFITLIFLGLLPWLVPISLEESSLAPTSPFRLLSGLGIAIGLGFLIGAIQLVPTWELKSLSQREVENEVFAPTYGHLPPLGISQLWMPWRWYAADKSTDELLQTASWGAVSPATNQVEAQLYLGLLPLLLSVAAIILSLRRPGAQWGGLWRWGIVIALSLILATGWPTRFLHWAPGIGFFRGPGRYSMLAAAAIAILSGRTLDYLLQFCLTSERRRVLALLALSLLTIGDLWASSRKYQFGGWPYIGRQIFYATMIDTPPVAAVPFSPLRRELAPHREQVRLYAPGQNIPTLMNVSAIPVYLGLGPDFYESSELRVDFTTTDPQTIQLAVQRLQRFGVTHLLLEKELDADRWPVRRVGELVDPVLNGAFGRREPFWMYQMQHPGRRVEFLHHADRNEILAITSTPQQIDLKVLVREPDELVLRDLWYPGWIAVGGAAPGRDFNEHFRAVDVSASENPQTISWVYQPQSVRWGGLLSVTGLCGVVVLGLVRRRPRSV